MLVVVGMGVLLVVLLIVLLVVVRVVVLIRLEARMASVRLSNECWSLCRVVVVVVTVVVIVPIVIVVLVLGPVSVAVVACVCPVFVVGVVLDVWCKCCGCFRAVAQEILDDILSRCFVGVGVVVVVICRWGRR